MDVVRAVRVLFHGSCWCLSCCTCLVVLALSCLLFLLFRVDLRSANYLPQTPDAKRASRPSVWLRDRRSLMSDPEDEATHAAALLAACPALSQRAYATTCRDYRDRFDAGGGGGGPLPLFPPTMVEMEQP